MSATSAVSTKNFMGAVLRQSRRCRAQQCRVDGLADAGMTQMRGRKRAPCAGDSACACCCRCRSAGAYDYRVPAGMAVAPGDFVVVPLGRREIVGVVWDGAADRRRRGRRSCAPMRRGAGRAAACRRRCAVRRLGGGLHAGAAGRRAAHGDERCRRRWSRAKPQRRLAARRVAAAGRAHRRRAQRVLAVLADGAAARRRRARAGGRRRAAAWCAAWPMPGAGRAGRCCRAESRFAPPDADAARACAGRRAGCRRGDALRHAGGQRRLRRDAARRRDRLRQDRGLFRGDRRGAAPQGRQVLVLLPEIALTAQWLDRFAARFGAPPALWHSDLTPRERRATWRAVAEGEARVRGRRALGAVPAVPDLGLIVVDEEHDTAFKQEDGVRLPRARHGGGARAADAACPVVLVSATPSLETRAMSRPAATRELHLPDAPWRRASCRWSRRSTCARDRPSAARWLSPAAGRRRSRDTLARGEQALLFLNRRGYAPLTLCRACGHRIQLPATAPPGWSSTALARRLHATIAAIRRRHPGRLPGLRRRRTASSPCGPGVERLAGGSRRAVARCAASLVMTSATPSPAPPPPASSSPAIAGPRGRPADRHADRRQGLPLPASDAGRRGRCRPRARRRRPARGRADLPAAAPGGRAAPGAGERPGRVLLQTFRPSIR